MSEVFLQNISAGTDPAVHQNDSLYHYQKVYSSNDTVTNFSLPVDMRADPTVVFYPVGLQLVVQRVTIHIMMALGKMEALHFFQRNQ